MAYGHRKRCTPSLVIRESQLESKKKTSLTTMMTNYKNMQKSNPPHVAGRTEIVWPLHSMKWCELSKHQA